MLPISLRHAVGELHLVAGAALHPRQVLDHLRHQHVAADDREVGGRDRGIGLLDQPLHLDQPAVVVADVEDAVAVGLLARHLGHRDDVAAGFAIRVGQLPRQGVSRQHEIVGQQDGERIVADEGAGAPDRVAEAERLLLAHRHDRAGRRGRPRAASPAHRLVALAQRAPPVRRRCRNARPGRSCRGR